MEKMRETNVRYLKCLGHKKKEISVTALFLTVNLFYKL